MSAAGSMDGPSAPLRGIASDERARVPFALVAAIVLLLAGVSALYITTANRDALIAQSERLEVEALDRAAETLRDEVESQAYFAAMRAVALALLNGTGPGEEDDEVLMSETFRAFFREYVDARFPIVEGDVEIQLRGWAADVFHDQKVTHDLVPDSGVKDTYDDVDSSQKYQSRMKGKPDKLDNKVGGVLREVNATAYYRVTGRMNLTLTDSKKDLTLSKSIRFDRIVDNPYPLLKSKFKNLASGAQGTNSEVARMTKFILTTVAQYRVLQGYGMMDIPQFKSDPAYTYLGSLTSEHKAYWGRTDSILTLKDVELAVNLALLLAVAKHYRTYDADVPEAIDQGYSAGQPEFPKLDDVTLQEILDTYMDTGTVDAADVVALYTGMGANDTFQISLESIIAQAFFVIIDQFILKFFDWIGLMPIFDVLWQGLQIIWNAINDFMDWVKCQFADCDPDWYYDILRPFLKDTAKKAGMGSSGLFSLMVRNRSQQEWNSYRGGIIDAYPRVNITEGPYDIKWVVRQTDDNHTRYANWSETSHLGYNASHTNDTVVGYEYMQFDTTVWINASEHEVPFSSVWTDHKSSLWRTFYDDNYDTSSGNSRLETIRETVVRTVRDVADDVVGLVRDLVWDHRFLIESVTPLVKGRFPLNPEDRSSFLREISREVEFAVNDIFNYYRDHKDLVKQLVKELIDETIGMYRGLRDHLSGNYDSYTGWPSQRTAVQYALADGLVPAALLNQTPIRSNFTSLNASYDDSLPFVNVTMVTPGVLGDLFRNGNVNGTGRYMEDLRGRLLDEVNQSYQALKAREVSDPDKMETEVNPNDGVLIQALDYLMFDEVNGLAGMIVNAIADTVANVMHGTGLIDMLRDFAVQVTRSTVYNSEAANSEYFQPTQMGVPLDFYVGGHAEAQSRKTVRYESLHLDQDDDFLEATQGAVTPGMPAPSGSLVVQMGPAVGVHYTAIGEISRRPYETVWNVSVLGEVGFSTRTESRAVMEAGTDSHQWYNDTVRLEFSISVVVFSGWPLDTVEYELSNTVWSDFADLILRLFREVWGVIGDPIMDVIDFFAKVVAFFQDVIGTLIRFAMQIVKLIIDAIDFVVSLVQKFVKYVLNSVLGWVVETVSNFIDWTNELAGALTGEALTIPIFGLYLSFEAPEDPSDTNPRELVVSLEGEAFGADVDFEVAFYRFPEPIRDSEWDVIGVGNITVGEGTFITLRTDPLMLVFPHMAEMHIASLDAKGNGWGFDWYMPYLEEYKELGWALSDVIGFKPTIPIPPLGVEASVDLGVKIKYHSPVVSALAINEVEMNPASGSQWVELFNPEWWDGNPATFGGKALEGYTLRSANGSVVHTFTSGETIGWRTQEGPAHLRVNVTGLAKPPPWTWTVDPSEIPNQLDVMRDYYLDPGDGVFLYDPDGNLLDRTPLRKDDKVFAFVFEGMAWGEWDARLTYQREYDGGPLWVLGDPTPGAANPGERTLDIKALIIGALKDSFLETWFELEDRMGFSLDFVGEFLRSVIEKFIDKVLDLIEKIVIEVLFYVDVAISAIGAQGAAGGGFRLSFVIDGVGLSALLRWLVDVLKVFVHNITTPNNPQAFPTVPQGVPEHMFIRLEGYLIVGVPASVRGVTPDSLKGEVPQQVTLVILIQANLPLFAGLMGKDWGRWRIDFGVYIEDFPSKIADTLFGYKSEEGAKISLWLVKVSLYEIRGGL
jgi:hypothetical protein